MLFAKCPFSVLIHHWEMLSGGPGVLCYKPRHLPSLDLSRFQSSTHRAAGGKELDPAHSSEDEPESLQPSNSKLASNRMMMTTIFLPL